MYTISDFENAVKDLNEGIGNEGFDVKSSIGNLFAGIKNYFQGKLLGLDKPLVLADVNAAKKVMGSMNYTQVMDSLIFQPQRLNVSYKELMPTLVQGCAYLATVEQTLPSVLTCLANLSNGESASVYVASNVTNAKNKTELMLQKAFNGRDVTEAVFSTRFESMTQYQATYVEFNTLVQGLLRRNAKDTRLNVDRIAALAELIHNDVASGALPMTAVQVKMLGDLMLSLARAVDVYSVTLTLMIATGTALNNTADKLLSKK